MAKSVKYLPVLALAMFYMWQPQPASSQTACSAPAPVCAARGAVYTLSSFDPFASAVRIGPKTLVTNRHVVADQKTVNLTRKDGGKITARVVPTSYEGDLILLEAEGLAEQGAVLKPVVSDYAGKLYTVAGDLSRRSIKVYPPGKLVSTPAPNHPYARLHSSAYSQPGNSGGALVDEQGRLVAVIASGGEGRYDSIPAGEIEKLKSLSGPEFKAQSRELGEALRICTQRNENLPGNLRNLTVQAAQALHNVCAASSNRPLYDLAAQALGRAGKRDLSLSLSKLSVVRDPNAVVSRLSLVITMMFSQSYSQALPHVRKLVELAPQNQSVQRFAIQIGKWGGDLELAQRGLALVKQHNPAQAQAAERFLNANTPPPPRRRRR